MQVEVDDVVVAVVVDEPRADVTDPRPGGVLVGELEHAHVAAVAAGPFDLAPRRGVVAGGGNDLDEGVTEGVDRVPKPEVSDAVVVERVMYAEKALEGRRGRVQIDRRDHCLTKPGNCHAPDARDRQLRTVG